MFEPGIEEGLEADTVILAIGQEADLAFFKSHVQTMYDPEKWVLCNRCVDVCPEYCLQLPPVD